MADSPFDAPDTSTAETPAAPEAAPAGLSPDATAYVDRLAKAGFTAAHIAGGLGTSVYEAGGSLNPMAVNPTSHAFGINQDLGPRESGLVSFLDKNYGGQATVAGEADYAANELATTEKSADAAIRATTTPEDAAAAWSHAFERPGAEGEAKEIPAAQASAARYYPLVQARLAELQGSGLGNANGGPNLEAPISAEPGYDSSWDQALKGRARAMGQPDPTLPGPPNVNKVQLPATETAPQSDPWGAALAMRNQNSRKAAFASGGVDINGQPLQTQPPAPPKGFFGELGEDTASLLPAFLHGAVATTLGLPADVVTGYSNWAAQHPQEAMEAASGGPLPGQSTLPAQPGATSPISTLIAPATSKSITDAANTVVSNLGGPAGYFSSPAERGDFDVGHNLTYNLGNFIGASIDPTNPLGILSGARAIARGADVGKTILGALGTHVLAPAGIAGGADLGQYAVGALGGSETQQELAGALAVPLGIGTRAAAEYALINGTTRGRAVAGNLGSSFGSGTAPKIYDNPAAASANLDSGAFEASLPYPEAGLPPGTQVPGPTRTLDQGGQAFFQQTIHNDAVANGNYRDLLSGNTAALHGAAPGGDPQDAVNFVRNTTDARQQTVDLRIQQARADADLAERSASTGTQGQQMLIGQPGKAAAFDYATELGNQIAAARDDSLAAANQDWATARADGFTTAQGASKPVYNELEGLAAASIGKFQPKETFPYRELAPLYEDGNMRGMFNADGTRKPATQGVGNSAGPNAVAGDTISLEQLHSVSSNLAASIRQEQDALRSGNGAGSSIKLANLNAARSVVLKNIDQITQDAGNYASMRTAVNSVAAFHNTFGEGPIGDILGAASNGNAVGKLNSYLGNSVKAQTAANAFTKAVEARTGAGQTVASPNPQGDFQAALADHLRQNYLLVRSEGGPKAGQKWLENNGAYLTTMGDPKNPTDPFARLGSDVERLNQSDVAVPALTDPASRTQDDVEMKLMATFLGGDGGKELEATLRGQAPGAGMQRLVEMTQQDTSGQAFRGLQRLVFDRIMTAAQKYDQSGNVYYSGKAAQAFMQDNKGAMTALNAADPMVGGNLRKIVNGMAAGDAIRAQPQVAGLPPTLGAAAPMAGEGLTGKALGAAQPFMGRILGNRFLGPIFKAGGGGGIQAHAIGAQAGSQAAGAIHQALTGSEAPHITAINNLRDAQFDTAKTQAYLNAQKAAAADEPTLAASTQLVPPSLRAHPGGGLPLGEPYLRGAAIQTASSAANAGNTTPSRPHQFPLTMPPGEANPEAPPP